jgi:hypothetical protein
MEMAGNGIEHPLLPMRARKLAGKIEQGLALPCLLAGKINLLAQTGGKLACRQRHPDKDQK